MERWEEAGAKKQQQNRGRTEVTANRGSTPVTPAEARQAGSISRFHVLDSSDLAGTIPYLGND